MTETSLLTSEPTNTEKYMNSGRKEAWLRQLYDDAIDGMIKNMLIKKNGALFLTKMTIPGMHVRHSSTIKGDLRMGFW